MKKKPKDEDEINTGRWQQMVADEEDGRRRRKRNGKLNSKQARGLYLLEWSPRARVQFQVIAIV